MNKLELISKIAKKAQLTKKDAEAALNATLDTITEAMSKGNKVQLVGFGSFETKIRAAHTGVNPATKEPMDFPAKTIPVFKAGAKLKAIVDTKK